MTRLAGTLGAVAAAALLSFFGASSLAAQSIVYKGETITLGPKALYLDGSLSNEEAAASEYIFNDFRKAAAALQDGTADAPMRLYIAPWVYWIDDPDDPAVRSNPDGSTPIGLTVRCSALRLLGMSGDPRDVILASARGQSQGSIGNFTMFDFYGDDLVIKDLTMGNYCNIDLVYPRNETLSRPKRNSAITQAQLAFCHGDRVVAENVRFEARLNLCPLNGAKRLFFKNCHFELTDDSLASPAVYLGCDFDFYGRQPFGSVNRYGDVFLDCEFNIRHGEAVQALSKSVGRHSIVDCSYSSGGRSVLLAWTFRPEQWLRCYEYNISLNGQPAFVGASKPYNTVCLEDKSSLLKAYRLVRSDGSVLYNSYNLLCGDDGWDPEGIKDEVSALGGEDIPVCLDIDVRSASVRTGETPVTLNAGLFRHAGYPVKGENIRWKVQSGWEKYVLLSPSEDGSSCTVSSVTDEDPTLRFDVIAYTDSGLEGAAALEVSPSLLPAPSFSSKPKVTISEGVARVEYTLNLGNRADNSLVTWYRCKDRRGSGAVPVAVSRGDSPKTEYILGAGDVGYYIMAGVAPKHIRSNAGEEVSAVGRNIVRASAVKSNSRTLETDFSDFPEQNQTEIIPGFWTVDAFKPADTHEYSWNPDLSKPCWTYGSGINGAKGEGLQQLQQGARLRYTPPKGKYKDMSVSWQLDPAKDGGQGFASARMQYLDLFIKFDTSTLSGYALRVIRTTKYANAVDVLLVQYRNGEVTPLSESVSVDCFLTGCVLSVEVCGDTLKAEVSGPGRVSDLKNDPDIKHSARLEKKIEPNDFGGFGLQHTSTVGSESRIMLHSVRAEWK